MGATLLNKQQNILNKKIDVKHKINVIMMGLDNAGKKTILYRLKKRGEIICVYPIQGLGLSIDTLQNNQLSLIIIDIGTIFYKSKMWRQYYETINWIIFVIDSSDGERTNQVKEQLKQLQRQLAFEKVQLLIWANKCDLQNAMSVEEISQKLLLNQLSINWKILNVSGLTQKGLFQGFDLINVYKK